MPDENFRFGDVVCPSPLSPEVRLMVVSGAHWGEYEVVVLVPSRMNWDYPVGHVGYLDPRQSRLILVPE